MFKKIVFIAMLTIGMTARLWAAAPSGSVSCEDAATRGASLIEAGDEISLQRAIELFEEALKKQSDCVPALVGYARAVNAKSGFYISMADYYKSYGYLARALVIDPDNAQAWWVMADLQRHMGRYERAIPVAKKAVEMNPDDPWAHYVFGSALMGVDINEAVKHLERALELKPGWDTVEFNLSAAYIHTDKLKEALKLLDSYLETHPGNIKAHTNRGIVYLKLGKLDKAGEDLQKALGNDPRFGPALKAKGDLYVAKKDYPKAIDSYKLALISMPDDVELWVMLAGAQTKAGLMDDAINSYTKLLQFNPGNEDWKKALEELKAGKENP